MGKIKDLQNWFKENITDDGQPYTLDKNQAKIVLDNHKNTLVTARAGSGKTRTIVAKVVYLLAHEKIKSKEIVVFSFNRKARMEINERLAKISYHNIPLFHKLPAIATTFHAFAYNTLGGHNVLNKKLLSEDNQKDLVKSIVKNFLQKKLATESFTAQTVCTNKPQEEQINSLTESCLLFINRAEQQFVNNSQKLQHEINSTKNETTRKKLQALFKIYQTYQYVLLQKGKTTFNQIMADASKEILRQTSLYDYRYIFVDEYQDFSRLFFDLIIAIRKKSPGSHLLAVGDDWQAINRFAGSNVDYFINFEQYFKEDCAKLFIPTNYRSGKNIVDNANFFMGKILGDYRGCKAGNKRKANIYYKNMLFEKYDDVVTKIVKKNPGKTIKILSRNNNPNFTPKSLTNFVEKIKERTNRTDITESTIHRSKGLESDVVILLEVDAKKFPSTDKTNGLYEIFGDNSQTIFNDEARLFYVALTRPKERLYILSKTVKPSKIDKKMNFFSYLNPEQLTEI